MRPQQKYFRAPVTKIIIPPKTITKSGANAKNKNVNMHHLKHIFRKNCLQHVSNFWRGFSARSAVRAWLRRPGAVPMQAPRPGQQMACRVHQATKAENSVANFAWQGSGKSELACKRIHNQIGRGPCSKACPGREPKPSSKAAAMRLPDQVSDLRIQPNDRADRKLFSCCSGRVMALVG